MKAIKRPDGSIEVDGTEEEIRRVFGLGASVPAPAPAPALTPGHPRRPIGPRPLGTRVEGSIPDKLLRVFGSQPSRTFQIKELADMIEMDPREVSAALSRMAREENPPVESPARGRYRAVAKKELAS